MGLLKYIVNLDEILDILKDKVKVNPGEVDTSNLEEFIQSKLNEILDLLKKILGTPKSPRSLSLTKNVPAIVNDFVLSKTFDKHIFLCGVAFSQSAWKVEDSFSLEVAGVLLFDHISTKEIGQYKHLNAFFPVPPGTEIKLIYHNESGNSKMVWFDLDYLEGEKFPDENPVNHDYDYKVILEWESGTTADIDIHCVLDCDSSKHIYYQNKVYGNEPNKVWLDVDYTSHSQVQIKPEILTILGKPGQMAHLYIKNFNGGPIRESVVLKIYRKGITGDNLFKIFEITPEKIDSSRKTFFICSLDLYSGNVLEHLKEIPHISGGEIDLSSCPI